MLVRKIDGVWTEWAGHNEPMPKTVNTRQVTYEDGRTETEECEPYLVFVTLSASALGGWSADELAVFGLKHAVLFEVPEGKQTIGAARYIEDGEAVRQEYDVIDIPPPTSEELKALAATLRWQREAGGVTVQGAVIDTSRESQALINGAFNLAKDDPDTIIRFKAAAGFVTLDAATMIAIGRAVAHHVQACFAQEGDVVDAIEAGTITTFAQIEAEFA